MSDDSDDFGIGDEFCRNAGRLCTIRVIVACDYAQRNTIDPASTIDLVNGEVDPVLVLDSVRHRLWAGCAQQVLRRLA